MKASQTETKMRWFLSGRPACESGASESLLGFLNYPPAVAAEGGAAAPPRGTAEEAEATEEDLLQKAGALQKRAEAATVEAAVLQAVATEASAAAAAAAAAAQQFSERRSSAGHPEGTFAAVHAQCSLHAPGPQSGPATGVSNAGMDVLSEDEWKQQEALMLMAAERELGGAMLSVVEEEAEEKEVGGREAEKAEAGAAEKRPRKAAGVSKEERSSPTPGPPRKSALWRADQLDDDTTDVASTAGSSASAWLSEAPTDFATDLADVADVQSLKQFSTAVARRRARAPPPVHRTLSSASTVVLEEEEGEEEEEVVVAEVVEAVEAEEEAAQWGVAAEVEPVLSEGEWERQESLMLLAAKESPRLLAAEEEEEQAAEDEQGHAPGARLLGACPSRGSRSHSDCEGALEIEHEIELEIEHEVELVRDIGARRSARADTPRDAPCPSSEAPNAAAAAAAPPTAAATAAPPVLPPPLAPPLLPPPTVGAVVGVVLFLSFALLFYALAERGVDGVGHAVALVVCGGGAGLVFAHNWLPFHRRSFLVGVLIVLNSYDQFSHATASLLEAEAAKSEWMKASDQRVKLFKGEVKTAKRKLYSGHFNNPLPLGP